MMGKGTYSIKMLIGSILAGVFYAIIGEVFYQRLKGTFPDLFIVTGYLMGLFFFTGFAVWIISKLVYHRIVKKVSLKQWIRIAFFMLVFTIGFEWLYEISFYKRTKQADSYIFVIDNSGSMDKSDPNGLRFEAIETVLSEKPKKFTYAIYLFSDSAELVRTLNDQTVDLVYNRGKNQGMTAIKKTLQTILEDIENKTLDFHGQNGHLILLSDGAATDLEPYHEFSAVLDGFIQQNISISTVGLLDADQDLMALIADRTGGVFVSVEDIADLDQAMIQAGGKEKEERNLLDYREGKDVQILYAGMRIGFLILLGGLIGLQKGIVCESFLDTSAVIRSSVVGSILAGICMEVGMNGFQRPAFVRGVFCVLISFTLLRKDSLEGDLLGAEVYRGK